MGMLHLVFWATELGRVDAEVMREKSLYYPTEPVSHPEY
jgi:hypothetical protein